MAVPFSEAEFEILIYMLLGAFIALTAASGIYIWKLRKYLDEEYYLKGDEEEEDLRVDNIRLSKRAEDVLNAVLRDPMLQSELPDELNVSKATISNAVAELFQRDLVIKKKKANTYRIEPNREELEKQQR
ncbi:MAG: helix-turn-helix transcriptional regulator [Candidatus Nanosalina sp.]